MDISDTLHFCLQTRQGSGICDRERNLCCIRTALKLCVELRQRLRAGLSVWIPRPRCLSARRGWSEGWIADWATLLEKTWQLVVYDTTFQRLVGAFICGVLTLRSHGNERAGSGSRFR